MTPLTRITQVLLAVAGAGFMLGALGAYPVRVGSVIVVICLPLAGILYLVQKTGLFSRTERPGERERAPQPHG